MGRFTLIASVVIFLGISVVIVSGKSEEQSNNPSALWFGPRLGRKKRIFENQLSQFKNINGGALNGKYFCTTLSYRFLTCQ